MGNTVSRVPKHGGNLLGCVVIIVSMRLVKHSDLALIREAIVSVVPNDKMLMYGYAHCSTRGQELSRYRDIILGGRRVS